MGKRRTWASNLFTSETPTQATYAVDRKRTFQGLHNALLAVDWTQTADTGQLAVFDETPGASSGATEYGYRIYKLNDEFSLESPVYMRLDFYTNAAGPSLFTFPDFRISIGNGTDGAGGLASPTPKRSLYEGKASTSFVRAVAPAVDTLSFAYSGRGISWIALNCGALAGNKTSTGIARVALSTDGNWPLRFFAVCRPMDETGAATALGACLLTVDVPGLATFDSHFNTGSSNTVVSMRADMLSKGGGVTTSTDVSARVMPDLLKTQGLKSVAAPGYGLFSGVALKLCGIASVPAVSVSPLDTAELAIGGVVPRLMIAPHPGVNGFNRLDSIRNGGSLEAYGSPEFDTLLLAWDGVDV